MTTNQNTTKSTSFGTFVRGLWNDQVSAQEAMLNAQTVRGLRTTTEHRH